MKTARALGASVAPVEAVLQAMALQLALLLFRVCHVSRATAAPAGACGPSRKKLPSPPHTNIHLPPANTQTCNCM